MTGVPVLFILEINISLYICLANQTEKEHGLGILMKCLYDNKHAEAAIQKQWREEKEGEINLLTFVRLEAK